MEFSRRVNIDYPTLIRNVVLDEFNEFHEVFRNKPDLVLTLIGMAAGEVCSQEPLYMITELTVVVFFYS